MLFEPYVLWPDPCVIAYQRDDLRCLELLVASAPAGAHVLYHCPNHDGRTFFRHLAEMHRSKVRFHLMANTELELAEYREAFDLPASYGPVSSFTNERTFDLAPGVAPDTDAVYVARFQPGARDHVKRLPLARQVQSLSVVTFCLGRRAGFREPFRRTFPELAHARVNNEFMAPAAVAQEIRRARVQLALSAREGCMLAFTEGLLCGVPAVSTRCRSARTEFFNPDDVLVCDDDAESVARAVSEMAERAAAPSSVRSRALVRLAAMRAEYVATIAALTGVPSSMLHEHIFETPGGPERLSFALPRIPPARRAAGRGAEDGGWG
jgi:glycosyltransferase involved in cell wall biosynthesis